VDAFSDDLFFNRHSKLLYALYTRGRHNNISTVTATQKFAAIAPIFRVNATELCCYRLRNYKDMEACVEEVSAICDNKTILDICSMATSEPHSFLFVDLKVKDKNEIFHLSFDKRMAIHDI
jgi:hypothetical protein